jgi:hypothetical protein
MPAITSTPFPIPNLRAFYFSDGNIWTIEPPAPPILFSPDMIPDLENVCNRTSRALLSDDGKRIVFMLEGGAGFGLGEEVVALNFNGSGYRRLLSKEQTGKLELFGGRPDSVIDYITWIPETHNLFLTTAGGPLGQSGLESNEDLFMLNADSGQYSKLLNAGEAGYPVPSPNGAMTALIKKYSISINRMDGAMLFEFPFPKSSEFIFGDPFAFAWTGDSVSFGFLLRNESDNGVVYSINISSGVSSVLGEIGEFSQVMLSPALDYVGIIDPNGLSMEALDGSQRILLSEQSGGFLSFAPDGKHYAYYVDSSQARGQAFLGSPDGQLIAIPSPIVPKQFFWINNSQYVYLQEPANIILGDIGGNFTTLLTLANRIQFFTVKNPDFFVHGD